MKEKDFLEKYSEFSDLFNIVSEPSNSKNILLNYQSINGMDSHMVYWYYQVQGFNELLDSIPEVEDWVYYYERFIKYGGDPLELGSIDYSQGQAPKKQTSGSNEPLIFLH